MEEDRTTRAGADRAVCTGWPLRAGTPGRLFRVATIVLGERSEPPTDEQRQKQILARGASTALAWAMDARQLKTLLRTLQEFGVRSYREADLTVEFGGAYGPPVPEGDVEGAEALKLPDGVPDVARQLADIRKAYEPKNRRPA